MRDAPEKFARKGLPLIDWLIALLSEEAEVRSQAALMYQAMQMGVVDEHTDVTLAMLPADPDAHAREFGGAVRAAVDSLGEHRASFVRRLLEAIAAGQHTWMESCRRDQERTDRVWDKLESRLKARPTPDYLEQQMPRIRRILCATLHTKTAPAFDMAAIVPRMVVDQLDVALLDAPDVLDRSITQRGLRHSTLAALARIGPPASAFLPRLLRELDELPDDGWWDGVAACAAIVRTDTDAIRGLVERLNASAGVAANAALVLQAIGAVASIHLPEAISALLAASERPEEQVRTVALYAFGPFGRDQPAVADRLARAIREGTMTERGYALSALAAGTIDATIAVPLLIGAFTSFEEFDPDQYDSGEHARIARALAAYGFSAAPALPELLKRVQNGNDWNRGVIECLGAIGPAARDALTLLERAASELGVDDWRTDRGYVAKALRAITGETHPV